MCPVARAAGHYSTTKLFYALTGGSIAMRRSEHRSDRTAIFKKTRVKPNLTFCSARTRCVREFGARHVCRFFVSQVPLIEGGPRNDSIRTSSSRQRRTR
jgi:hypothetical protein